MDDGERETGQSPDSRDVLTRPARPPDLVLRYGDLAGQVADVHLPGSVGGRSAEAALVLFLHGGFWRAAYGREHTRPLAEALSAQGYVVCAPEYRRTGQLGGGWPGTFDDVAAAVDRLPDLLEHAAGGMVGHTAPILAGHSAGGHLALWAASRHRLPAASQWRATRPAATGVVALAAVSDLVTCFELALGDQAVGDLLDGGPAQVPERYALADPARLLPVGLPVCMVHGELDDIVPSAMSEAYAERARRAGDEVRSVLLRGAGHFDVIDPLSAAWPEVVNAFRLMA